MPNASPNSSFYSDVYDVKTIFSFLSRNRRISIEPKVAGALGRKDQLVRRFKDLSI